MELWTASIHSCLTIKKLQDKVSTSYYFAKWSKINIFQFFSVKKSFQPIYTDYAYFERKKITLKIFCWNALWLAHFQNYMLHPNPASSIQYMAAIIVSRKFISWNFSMKFRSQIKNQMSDYRLLGASSVHLILMQFFSLNWL